MWHSSVVTKIKMFNRYSKKSLGSGEGQLLLVGDGKTAAEDLKELCLFVVDRSFSSELRQLQEYSSVLEKVMSRSNRKVIYFIIISSFISQTENILLLWRITHHKKYFLLDTVLENFPNQLTETAEFLCLADTAGYIDISYPPLMRPERKVDVVLHLNYSSGSQTSVR